MKTLEQALAALESEQLPNDEIRKVPRSDNDYVSAHYVIKTANRIFGPDGWKHEVITQKIEHQGQRGNNAVVVVRCIVRVYAIGTHHDGTGVGLGEMPQLGGAMELALKSSETDAIKRALKNFGDVLGLALYEKVEKGEQREGVGASTVAQDLLAELQRLPVKTGPLDDWYTDHKAQIGKLVDADRKAINEAFDAKIDVAMERSFADKIDDARDQAELEEAFHAAEKQKLPQLAMKRLVAKAKERKAALANGAANDRGNERDRGDDRSYGDDENDRDNDSFGFGR
jgi:hypothetical protein